MLVLAIAADAGLRCREWRSKETDKQRQQTKQPRAIQAGSKVRQADEREFKSLMDQGTLVGDHLRQLHCGGISESLGPFLFILIAY